MNDGKIILGEYEQIAALTRRMLEAARRSEWDALIALERDCGQHFARLLDGSIVPPEDDVWRGRKAALIRGILDDDAEIRLLVDPWLAQLSQLIGTTRQQNRLQNAYHPAD